MRKPGTVSISAGHSWANDSASTANLAAKCYPFQTGMASLIRRGRGLLVGADPLGVALRPPVSRAEGDAHRLSLGAEADTVLDVALSRSRIQPAGAAQPAARPTPGQLPATVINAELLATPPMVTTTG